MSWQYSDAPSHIAPEVGANLLTGGGPWSGVALEPGAVYALSVEVLAPAETTVGWGVTATDGNGGEYVLADAADGEAVPGGQWVTVTRNLPAPAFPTTAAVTLTVPAGTQARNPSMGALTGRTVLTVPGDVLAENIMASGGIIAGTPDGARVELNEDGLVAYDGTGTQTAHIAGEEGVFVGGEFRTSDTLPGQVTLSDDALSTSVNTATGPGIRITPEDTSGFEYMPGIGPSTSGLMIYGGKRVGTGASIVQANPTESFMRTFREDGTVAGEVQASDSASYLRTYQADGTAIGGSIQTSARNAFLQTYGPPGEGRAVMEADRNAAHMRVITPAGLNSARISADGDSITLFSATGGQRYLKLNDTGIWIEVGGEAYNLELTASDSGWQAITPESGFAPIPEGFHVRQLGRMIYLRGAVHGNVTTDWVTMGTIPEGFRPTVRQINSGASSTITNLMFQTGTSGALQVKGNNTGTGLNIFVNTILYPVD